jgi:addiction module HigA family antidote
MPMKNPNHPGDIIRDCLDELGVNVTDGAKALGVTRATLSRLINRKAGISAEMAVRLEKAIGSTAGFWLRLQLNYDLAQVQAQSRKSTSAAWAPQLSLRGECAGPESALASRLDVKARCRSRSGHAI